MGLEQIVHRDLVGDAVRHRDLRLALAARVQRQEPTVDFDVDIPGRAPAGHAVDPGHGATDVVLHPRGEPRAISVSGRVHAFVHVTENI